MSTIGNDLKAAHDLLESQGNCAGDLYQEETGHYCAWGALNKVMFGDAYAAAFLSLDTSEHFEALAKHLPEDFLANKGLRPRTRVVGFNNTHVGQPVIDLFAKAAADEGYEVQE